MKWALFWAPIFFRRSVESLFDRIETVLLASAFFTENDYQQFLADPEIRPPLEDRSVRIVLDAGACMRRNGFGTHVTPNRGCDLGLWILK